MVSTSQQEAGRAHPHPLSIALGGRVRSIRHDQGLTLRGLAGRLGVSPATMSAIENGRTSISAVRLAEIARVLDVDFESLLVGSDEPVASASADRNWRHFDEIALDASLQAALEAFLEIGYHGATMRDIAKRAKLSVPGVYHHYSSKQEMLVAIIESTLDEVEWRTRAAWNEGTDPVSRFSNLVESLALFHTKRRDWGFVGRGELRSVESPEQRARIRSKRVDTQELFLGEIEQGCAAGVFEVENPTGAALASVMLCVGLSQWFVEGGPQTAEEVALEYVGYALRLVGHRPSS